MVYVAFLRGINVSGQKKIKMADLRDLFEKSGFCDVRTYIQSGNVVFESDVRDTEKIGDRISGAIEEHYDFRVPIIVKKKSEIDQIIAQNPFVRDEDIQANKIYFVLLKTIPSPTALKDLSAMHFDNEQLLATPTCVYLRCALGAGKAKCTNNLIERKLGVLATSRNHRTMVKLLELAKA